jgi:SPOR domain
MRTAQESARGEWRGWTVLLLVLLPLLGSCGGAQPSTTALGDKPAAELDPAERLAKVERDVAALRSDYDQAKPAIDRLVAIEGDIRTLVSQLGQVNAQAAGAPTAAPAIAAAKPPDPAPRPGATAKPAPAAGADKPVALPSAPAQAKPAPTASSVSIAPTPIGPPRASTEGKFAIHLATYQRKAAVAEGWAEYRRQYHGVLDALQPWVSEIDLHDGRGTLYRLKAGPYDSAAVAQAACTKIEAYPASYCKVTDLSGVPGNEFWGRGTS